MYDQQQFVFLANGKTKKVFGQRPYGVGTFVGGGVALFESLLGLKDEDVGMMKGEALLKESTYYNTSNYYIVFPPSDSYIFTSAVGWIELENRGDEEIILISQQRKTQVFGETYTLKTSEKKSFDYKGNWCIEIRSGNPQNISISQHSTNGGGTKGNELGMVPKSRLL